MWTSGFVGLFFSGDVNAMLAFLFFKGLKEFWIYVRSVIPSAEGKRIFNENQLQLCIFNTVPKW